MNVLAVGIGAIVGVISILVFSEVYASLNKTNISTGAQSLLALVGLLLAAVLIVGIIVVGFSMRSQ